MTKPNDDKTLKELNVLNIGHAQDAAKLSADDDDFTEFNFEKQFLKTSVLNMQEIFIMEKGQEAMRALNINLNISKKKDEPNMEKKSPKSI